MQKLAGYEVAEIASWAAKYREGRPVLHEAAVALQMYMDWVNMHSDGWEYWVQPRISSAMLEEELAVRFRHYLNGWYVADLSPEIAENLIVPMKQFLRIRNVTREEFGL